MDSAAIFFYNTLQCESLVEEREQESNSYGEYQLVERVNYESDEDEELKRAIEESLKMC
jgi:hypothetical protein